MGNVASYQRQQNLRGLDTTGLGLDNIDELENHPGVAGRTSSHDFGANTSQNSPLFLSAAKKFAAFVRNPHTWTTGIACLVGGLFAEGNAVALRSSALMLNGSRRSLDDNNFNLTVVPGMTDPAAELKRLVANDEHMRREFAKAEEVNGLLSYQVATINKTFFGETRPEVKKGMVRQEIQDLGLSSAIHFAIQARARLAAMNGANYLLGRVKDLLPSGVIFKNASDDNVTAATLLEFTTDGAESDKSQDQYPNCIGTSTYGNVFSSGPYPLAKSTEAQLAELRKIPGLQNLSIHSEPDTRPEFQYETVSKNPASQVFITGAQALAKLNGTEASFLREAITCLTNDESLTSPYSGPTKLRDSVQDKLNTLRATLLRKYALPMENVSIPPLTLESLHKAYQTYTGQKITLDEMMADVNAVVAAICLGVGAFLTSSAVGARIIQGPLEKLTPDQARQQAVEMASIAVSEPQSGSQGSRGSSPTQSVGSTTQNPFDPREQMVY